MKKTIKAWAVVSAFNGVIGKPEVFVVEAEEVAKAHAAYWNEMMGEPNIQAVPCTITYEIPTPKEKI